MMSISSPTALRTASRVRMSSRTSALWKRSFSALNPSATICCADSTLASSPRSSPVEAYAFRLSAPPPSAAPHDPLVRGHLHDVDARRGGGQELPGGVERPRHRHLEQADLDLGDLHRLLLALATEFARILGW